MTDERGDSICLRSGHHRIVDGGGEFPWTPGQRVVHGRVLVTGHASVHVAGELRVTSVEHTRTTAQAADVTAFQGCFVRLLLGARGHLHMQTRFEAHGNAQAHLHDNASGRAYDEVVIFAHAGWTGEVLVLGHRVRVVPPVGRALLERETRRGFMVRLAPELARFLQS